MNRPECGADNVVCQPRFNEFLILEFTDPAAYGAVHPLTVAAYMLQHSSKMSREGWTYEQGLLRKFLDANQTPEVVGTQNRDWIDGGQYRFTIKAGDGKPVAEKTAWTKSILDVRTESASVYCDDVTTWARSALEDVQGLAV